MNKWLSTLMAVIILVTLLLTGCGQKKEQVTVTFSYPPFGYDSAKEDAFWTKYIAAFEKEYPDIKIDMTIESWDTVDAKWSQMIQSGNTADIGYESPGTIIDYSSQGVIIPVTDVVNKLGGESAFSPSMHFMKNGNDWYAVPNCDANKVLIYRKDLLKAAGYDNPPTTWDELIKVAQACTKPEQGVYGLGLYLIDMFYSAHDTVGLMKASGGEMLDKDGKLIFDTPENLKALQYVSDLVNKYKVVSPNAVSWAYGDLVSALGTGKIAMAFEWGGFGTLLESSFPDEYKNFGFTIMPSGPSGHTGSFSGMGGFFIFKDGKHHEEAKTFIEYMSRAAISKEWSKISGNVSPFLSVANDPELKQMEWYKAMAEQSATAVLYGWDWGTINGSNAVQVLVQKAVIDVTSRGVKPEVALKELQENAQKALDQAAAQAKS